MAGEKEQERRETKAIRKRMLNPTVACLQEKRTEKGKKIMYVHRDESLVVKTKMILRWRSREKKGKGDVK